MLARTAPTVRFVFLKFVNILPNITKIDPNDYVRFCSYYSKYLVLQIPRLRTLKILRQIFHDIFASTIRREN